MPIEDMQNDILSVKIHSRDEVMYEGSASAVTSVNEKGVFDILLGHSRFVCTIYEHVVVHLLDGSDKKYEVGQGILWVKGDGVKVFLGV